MGFKETAGQMFAQQQAEKATTQAPEGRQPATEEPPKKKGGRKAKAPADSLAALYLDLDNEEKAAFIKKLREQSQFDATNKEKRTQRLTLVMRPSIIRRAKEAVKAGGYKSLTDFIEESIERNLDK